MKGFDNHFKPVFSLLLKWKHSIVWDNMKSVFAFGFCICENVVEIISHLTALKENADIMPAITTDKIQLPY